MAGEVTHRAASHPGAALLGRVVPLATAQVLSRTRHGLAAESPSPTPLRITAAASVDYRGLCDTQSAALGAPGSWGRWRARAMLHGNTLVRGAAVAGLFGPLVLLAPLCLRTGWAWARRAWMAALRRALEAAGPAFIKWGQWAATRTDLFPRDMCRELERLQRSAPAHSFAATRRTVEAAFGAPLESIFASFDSQPVASGSIAQVHRATLKPGLRLEGDATGPLERRALGSKWARGAGGAVAVKVRHPGVGEAIRRDFQLLRGVAALAACVPGLEWLKLDESVRQFEAPLFEQVDLRLEAGHLARFNANLSFMARNLKFPEPVWPLVQPDVLVETFEEGLHLTTLLDSDRAPYTARRQLARTGIRGFFQMLLVDNFVHADLHPGNMLVRAAPRAAWEVALDGLGLTALAGAAMAAAERAAGALRLGGGEMDSRIGHGLGPSLAAGAPSSASAGCGAAGGAGEEDSWRKLLGGLARPQLVLLDAGMAAELPPGHRQALFDFFKAVSRHDGAAVATATLRMSETQSCRRPEAFVADVASSFARNREDPSFEGVSILLDLVRRHRVHISGEVCMVLVTSLVLEGWSYKLDPHLSYERVLSWMVYKTETLKGCAEMVADLVQVAS